MINFIIPLQSRESSKNWDLVSEYCNQTIRSIENQTDKRWRIILVCNQPPNGLKAIENLYVVNTDLPVSGSKKERMEDKWRKVRIGLLYAKTFGASYCMITDADDLLHKDLSGYVHKHGNRHGFIVRNGYVWDTNSPFLFFKRKFNLFCGTSSIIWADVNDFPSENNTTEQEVPMLKFGHTIIESEFNKMGKTLKQITFPCIIYRASSGENHSGIRYFPSPSKKQLINQLLNIKFLSRKIKNDFSIL